MLLFRVKLAATKNLKKKKKKKLTRTLPHSSIRAVRHMVAISFTLDHWNQRCNFFFLILVLFLKGDINDKNHMVVGTRGLNKCIQTQL